MSGRGKNVIRRGKHTDWRRQREGLIRKRKEREKARSTHELDTAERRLLRHRKKHIEKEALTVWRWQGGDSSGHRKIEAKRGALTSWKWKKDEFVRAQKESDEEEGAHCLETAEGVTYQHKETKRLSKGHPLSEEGRGRNLSEHEKRDRVGGSHFLETAEGGTCQNTGRSDRPRATHSLETIKGPVRTWEESDRARGTHELETAKGGTCQNKE